MNIFSLLKNLDSFGDKEDPTEEHFFQYKELNEYD
jgi:hypothetical protein